MTKKVLLSGIQPSGRLHIGNYFGAIKQIKELQDSGEYDVFVSIVNYHALTTVSDKETLIENTKNAIIDHLALGIKPENLFLQSDIPEVTELTWIFNTLITVPYLSRAVAYKEKLEKGLEATAGLFDYPVLMAADILIVDADIVPVGQDQKQHVEIACDVAGKFNDRFGETFKRPKEHILGDVAVVPGIDGQKMSKSYKNTIPIFAGDDDIEKCVMSVVTDSKGTDEPKDPNTDTVFALHRLFSLDNLDDLEKKYRDGAIGYKEAKEILLENIKKFVAPLREKRNAIVSVGDPLVQIKEGRGRAQEKAGVKMKKVREAVGINF